MVGFISIVHILIALVLIVLVLIQDSKGGAMGATFGGGGGGNANSILGATGAANFLTKLTRWIVIVFAVTCIALTRMASNTTSSVLDEVQTPPPPATNNPAMTPIPTGEKSKNAENEAPIEPAETKKGDENNKDN